MMRPGWNPVRRNRNIGTVRQGHGANNSLVIPESWHSPLRFWERLAGGVKVRRKIGGKDQLFLVEPPQAGWCYPCSIADMVTILTHCPAEDLERFDHIVLRQPTRKQCILSPVWGRAVPAIEIGNVRGSAIVIEAQPSTGLCWSESRSVSPERRRELERLREDGHRILPSRRCIQILSSMEAMRSTVLYRTLLHEIGHHVDRSSCDPVIRENRATAEKENFAHLYANKLLAKLAAQGVVPIVPCGQDHSLLPEGLKPEWFFRQIA